MREGHQGGRCACPNVIRKVLAKCGCCIARGGRGECEVSRAQRGMGGGLRVQDVFARPQGFRSWRIPAFPRNHSIDGLSDPVCLQFSN